MSRFRFILCSVGARAARPCAPTFTPQTALACCSSRQALVPDSTWGRGLSQLALGLVLTGATVLFAPAAGASPAKSRPAELELRNSVEDLPEASVKAIDLRLPTDGWLDLEFLVHRGSGVTVHVIARAPGGSGLKVNQFRIYPDFSVSDTTTARKSAWLPRGDYYLTLINANAKTPSKVRVFAHLRPGRREIAAPGE